MNVLDLLTPSIIGPERETRVIDDWEIAATAFAGTGFNPESRWHQGGILGPFGSGICGLRYAIAIQQLRDAKRWKDADDARVQVTEFGFHVENGKDKTTVTERFS